MCHLQSGKASQLFPSYAKLRIIKEKSKGTLAIHKRHGQLMAGNIYKQINKMSAAIKRVRRRFMRTRIQALTLIQQARQAIKNVPAEQL
jgi:hypothetical protein